MFEMLYRLYAEAVRMTIARPENLISTRNHVLHFVHCLKIQHPDIMSSQLISAGQYSRKPLTFNMRRTYRSRKEGLIAADNVRQ